MKLCFNTIACRNEEDRLLEIIAEIAGLGEYQAVELWLPDIDRMDREKARDLAALCSEKGLDLPIVTSVLGVLRLEMDDLDQQLTLCRKLATLAEWLGARLVRAFPGFVGEISSRNPDPEYYKWVVDAFRQYCRILADSGLTMVSETHSHTFVDTAKGALKFVDDIGEPNHGFILQLGVVPRWSEMDALQFYRTLQDKVLHMHLHPYPWKEHEDNLTHYAQLLPILEKEKADFYVSIENCDALVPPLEAARWGAELVRRFVAGERVSAPEDS